MKTVAGLYIHVPFCRKKCPYCGFYSIASQTPKTRWLKALQKETALYRNRFDCFNSLYIGGGTPSLLETSDLESVMACLQDHFTFSRDVEVTIEANPEDITPNRAKELTSLGVNRISLGVQAIHQRELNLLGRRHGFSEVEKAFESLRSAGFKNVGVDLIYGIPGQTSEDLKDTLKRILSFDPEHLSCYQMTFEKGTPFWVKKEKGEIRPVSEDQECALFILISERLRENDYIHYEVSNFARNRGLFSRHNQKYWDRSPYLGLGPSAHSFQSDTRWWNIRSVRRYCEALEGGSKPVEGCEVLTDEQVCLEQLALGLRTSQGIDISMIPKASLADGTLLRLERAGFLTVGDKKVIPTRRGFLVADSLPLSFDC